LNITLPEFNGEDMDDEGRRCGGRCLIDSALVPHRGALRVIPEINKNQAYGKIVYLRFLFLGRNMDFRIALFGFRV
jgi:hypothetical protein